MRAGRLTTLQERTTLALAPREMNHRSSYDLLLPYTPSVVTQARFLVDWIVPEAREERPIAERIE